MDVVVWFDKHNRVLHLISNLNDQIIFLFDIFSIFLFFFTKMSHKWYRNTGSCEIMALYSTESPLWQDGTVLMCQNHYYHYMCKCYKGQNECIVLLLSGVVNRYRFFYWGNFWKRKKNLPDSQLLHNHLIRCHKLLH